MTEVNKQEQLEILLDYYESTQRKMSPLEASVTLTSAYIKLIFAWGFARLGHHTRANELLLQANSQSSIGDSVHVFLKENYTQRIQHALQGLPMETPITAELSRQLISLGASERYKVDRLRQVSSILEVQERLDALDSFQRWGEDPRGCKFTQLRGLEDGELLRERINIIIKTALSATTGVTKKIRLLDGVMDFFPMLGESFAIPILRVIINQLDEIPAVQRCILLEKTLTTSAYFRQGDMVCGLLARLEAGLAELSGNDLLQMAETLSVCLSSLRRIGLLQEMVPLLETVFKSINGDDLSTVIARLQLVSGLAEFSQPDRFQEMFDMGERALTNHNLAMRYRLALTKALVNAISRLPMVDTTAQLQNLARQLPQITDSLVTNSHFCISALQFIESLVFGFADDISPVTPVFQR